MSYPNEWSEMALQDIAILTRGKFSARPRNDPRFFGGEYPFVQTGDVRNAHVTLKDYSQTLNESGLKVSRLFPKGTLLFTIAANIGEVGFLGFDGACPDSLVAITPKAGVSERWLYYQLGFLQPAFEAAATQNAQLNINLEKLNPFRIPVPTPTEQKAIAEALSDADALIEGLERLIAKKRLIKQGAMQDLLTAKRRLPGFSGEWVAKNLGELVTIVMGQSPSSSAYNSQGDGLPLIQGNADIKDRRAIARVFTREVTKLGKAGDYLMTVRAPVGEIAQTDMDVCLGRGVCALRTNERIIYHIMVAKEPEWAKLSKGSTFDSVNGSEIRAFEVLFPTDVEEQVAVTQLLDDMDAEIQALETRLEKARQIKEGMMQNLLTGRIRLV